MGSSAGDGEPAVSFADAPAEEAEDKFGEDDQGSHGGRSFHMDASKGVQRSLSWGQSPKEAKAMSSGGLLWLAAEGGAVLVLMAGLVRFNALLGRSPEQHRNGISPIEQVLWNFQKTMRCILFVLCFSNSFLRNLPHKARSWPSLVFAHMARTLWLLSNDEPEAFLWRRHLCFMLIVLIRAAVGTVRSFLKMRMEGKTSDGDDDGGGSSSVCSGFAISWIIFLLDVVSNSGFIFGFLAGRAYFTSAAEFVETQHLELDPDKESFLRSASSKRDTMSQWWKATMRRPQPAGRRDAHVGTDDRPGAAEAAAASSSVARSSSDVTDSTRGGGKPRAASDDAVGTPGVEKSSSDGCIGESTVRRGILAGSRNGEGGPVRRVTLPEGIGRPLLTSPLKVPGGFGMMGETPSRRLWQRSCDWNQLEDMFQERGPVFWEYARLALVGLTVASFLECYFLQYWEVGILGGREDEVDVFHFRAAYFVPHMPDFDRWRIKRVVLGSWRDVIYMCMIHPVPCAGLLAIALCIGAISRRRRWRFMRGVLERLAIGGLSYVVLLSAHRVYFALSCLLICWECKVLEIKANRFARAWTELSPRRRWHWHAELGSEIKALDERLAPLISYIFIQRLAYLALDLARQSCESTLPFNLVHYLFRHVMFLAALSMTLWRIGKLNFSYYEKLQNCVLDAYPHNWADVGTPGVTQNEIILQRNHIEDWRHYLAQQIDSGRREACVCIFHLRWAAKSHVLALSILMTMTLPLINKIMDTYGRHVVNDRLLSTSPSPMEPWSIATAALLGRNMCVAGEGYAAPAPGPNITGA